jgi:hypothetical protein
MSRALKVITWRKKWKANRRPSIGTAELIMAAVAVLFPHWFALAQDQAPQGIEVGNYNLQQSVEFGGRVANVRGNGSVYDTFVNLHSGPRLYEQTLSMRSLNNQGLLFDNLYVSSFGYGGDPNDATRLRAYKNKWYDFSGSFRRDLNYWNYNLLANPLNPANPAPFPTLTVNNSLHFFDTVRRTSDFRLALLPQSRVRVRLGYSRNVSEGPSYSSIHEGTETQLFQDWKTTVNAYQMGIDFHVLPNTSFSYDQFLNYYKGDTSWVDQNFSYVLSNGIPVDLGVSFNSSAAQPCAVPISNATMTPAMASASCNAYIAYSRMGRPRTSQPTEQFSFESSYVPKLNTAGRVIYSNANNGLGNFSEIFNGSVTRTLQRGVINSGGLAARRVSTTVDWAATYTLTSTLRVVDEFRFNNFRIPGAFNFTNVSQFPQAPSSGSTLANLLLLPAAVFSATACPAPYTAPACPQHNASSGADLSTGTNVRYLAEDVKYNTFRVEYDFTKRYGGSIGYRYGRRNISDFSATLYSAETFDPGPVATSARRGDCAGIAFPAGCVQNSDGSVTFSGLTAGSDAARNIFPINEHSALLGLWARPNDALRVNFDLEIMSADNAFTRISPRNLQRYKFRATYKPRNWATLAGRVNIIESRDNVALVGNIQHNRNYGASVSLEPNERFDVDFGYEYSDVFSMSDICYASSAVPTTSTPCPLSGGGPTLGISEYSEKTKFGYANLIFKPARRVTATLGYAVNSANGNAPVIDPTTGLPVTVNPLTPSGPLDYNYHKPYAGVALAFHKDLTWRVAWGYYEYEENATPDPTGPRSFHANLVDLTLRYAF